METMAEKLQVQLDKQSRDAAECFKCDFASARMLPPPVIEFLLRRPGRITAFAQECYLYPPNAVGEVVRHYDGRLKFDAKEAWPYEELPGCVVLTEMLHGVNQSFQLVGNLNTGAMYLYATDGMGIWGVYRFEA
jgi:hypothetical protein